MKKIVFALFVGSLFVACDNIKNNEFKVDATFNGIQSTTYFVLEEMNESNIPMPVDTFKTENGKITFKKEFKQSNFYSLRMIDLPSKVTFVGEKGNIKISAHVDSLPKYEVSGTYSNDHYMKYQKEYDAINQLKIDFENANIAALQTAQQNGDSETIQMLIEQRSKFDDDIFELVKRNIKEYPESLISAMFINQFLDLGLVNDLDFLKKSYYALPKDLKNTFYGKSAKEKLDSFENQDIKIGDIAPDVEGFTPDGEKVNLHSFLGKVTLIDFWASWCGPCRRENPNLVKLYNDYKDKGFQIIGYSLDSADGKTKWINAIESDKLTWPQMTNLLHFDDPVINLYQFADKGIPATFLVDQEGKIIAMDLRGSQLRAKLDEVLQ